MSDRVTIILEHRRIGEMYEGKVVLRSIESDHDQTMVQFGKLPYEDMVLSLSGVMQDWENVTLVFQRTERPGLNPYVMDEATARQIRENPKAYVEATTMPHVKVDMRKLREKAKVKVEDEVRPTDSVKFTVKTGHDTLAEAFGDEVYCRRRNGQIECVICGRWHPIPPSKVLGHHPNAHFSYDLGESWAVVPTDMLLTTKQERYYLPREWNTSGPWISHEDLQNRYTEYLKEKEQCLTEATQG